LEVIQKKRSEKPEVRDAAREAALRYAFHLSTELFLAILLLWEICISKAGIAYWSLTMWKAILLQHVPFLMVLHGIYLVCKFVVRSRSALRRPRMRRRPRKRKWQNLRRHKPRVQHRRVLKAPRLAVAVGSAECPLHHRDSSVN
jgi:hypothetical protein